MGSGRPGVSFAWTGSPTTGSAETSRSPCSSGWSGYAASTGAQAQAGWDLWASHTSKLTTVYRQAGKDTDARKAAIARRADLRRYGSLTWYRKAANWFLDKTIKFGYQTWRAVIGLAVVFVAFLVMTFVAQQHQARVDWIWHARGHRRARVLVVADSECRRSCLHAGDPACPPRQARISRPRSMTLMAR